MVAEYAYSGAGRLVKETFKNASSTVVVLDYTGGSDEPYAGFDRFGRIKGQRWHLSGTDKDDYEYGYDYNSNRTYRDNTLTSDRDWAYTTYDDLNRLIGARQRTPLGGRSPRPSRQP